MLYANPGGPTRLYQPAVLTAVSTASALEAFAFTFG